MLLIVLFFAKFLKSGVIYEFCRMELGLMDLVVRIMYYVVMKLG